MEPVKIVCPNCAAVLSSAKPLPAGKKVRCVRCNTAFTIPAGEQVRADKAESRPKTADPRPPSATPERSPPTAAAPADVPAAPPAPRPATDSVTFSFDSAVVKLDKPIIKSKRPEHQRNSPNKRLVLGVAGAALSLCLGAIVAWQLLAGRESKDKPATQVEKTADTPLVAETSKPPEPARAEPKPTPEPVTLPAIPPVAQVQNDQKEKSKTEAPKEAKPKEVAKASTPPPAPPPSRPASFDDWLQDLEQAKQLAAKEGKDILILFGGSDWCGWSVRLAREVFFQPELHQFAEDKFVLVHLDFPEKDPAKSKVENEARNQRLHKAYHIGGFPSVVLTDALGRPYAFEGYKNGGAAAYCTQLAKLRSIRTERDGLFNEIAREEGNSQLQAAKKAVDFIEQHQLLPFYRTELEEWGKLATKHDPNNQKGEVELFFEKSLKAEFIQADEESPSELINVVKTFRRLEENLPFQE